MPPRPRVRSGRLLILAVLVVVAVILPAGAALLDRRQPAALEPRTPPSSASTAVQTYPPGTPAPPLRLRGLDGSEVDLAALWCEPCVR